MAIHIRRREVIVGLGGTAAAWPIGSIAQQPTKKIRSLGLLLPGLPEASMGKATRDRLRELGYAEGRDILHCLCGNRQRAHRCAANTRGPVHAPTPEANSGFRSGAAPASHL